MSFDGCFCQHRHHLVSRSRAEETQKQILLLGHLVVLGVDPREGQEDEQAKEQ